MVTFELPRGRGLRRQPVGRRRAVRAAPHRSRCLGGRCSAPRHGCEPGRDGARRSPAPARNLEPLLKALSCTCQNLLFNIQFQYDRDDAWKSGTSRVTESPLLLLFTDQKRSENRWTERRPRPTWSPTRHRRRGRDAQEFSSHYENYNVSQTHIVFLTCSCWKLDK